MITIPPVENACGILRLITNVKKFMIKYRLRFGLHVDVAWYSEQPFAKTTLWISNIFELEEAVFRQNAK